MNILNACFHLYLHLTESPSPRQIKKKNNKHYLHFKRLTKKSCINQTLKIMNSSMNEFLYALFTEVLEKTIKFYYFRKIKRHIGL